MPELFSNDARLRIAVNAELREEFDFCQRYLRYFASPRALPRTLDRFREVSANNEDMMIVWGALYVRILRQFRAVITLCSIADAENSQMIVRSLYESIVQLLFLIRPRLRIKLSQNNGQLDALGIVMPKHKATIPSPYDLRR